MRGQLGRYVVRGGRPSTTPDWETVVWDISDASGTVTSEQISGTNFAITLRLEIEWPVVPEDDGDNVYDAEVWFRVTSTEIVTVVGTPEGDGFTLATQNQEIQVEDGEWVSFMSKNPPAGTADNKVRDAVVTVRNVFTGEILDTFGAQVRD
jgi:hypothetical protein